MAVIGTSQAQRDALEARQSIFDDVLELQKGDNIHRVIQGPQKTNVMFYPTVFETEDQGKTILKPSQRALNFLEVPQLINSLQQAENSIRQELGDTKGDPGFRIQTRWWYIAINVLNKTDIKAKPVRYPKSVKDEITDIETKLDIQEPDYLLNGMFYLYNFLIEKIIDPKKSKRYGTSYKTSIYGDNPWKGRIPKDYLKLPAAELIQKLGGLEAIFPPEYLQAVNECDIDLEEVLKPMTDLQVIETLQKHPINLLGRRANDNKLAFPQTGEFKEMIEALGLPTVSIHFNEEGEPEVTSTSIQTGKQIRMPEEESVKEEPVKEEPATEIKEEVKSPGIKEPQLKPVSGIKDLPTSHSEETKDSQVKKLKDIKKDGKW